MKSTFLKTAEKDENGYIVLYGNVFNTDEMKKAEQYNAKIQKLALARIAKGNATQRDIKIAYNL